MQEKSLKVNVILNAVKTIMGMIFPLITFPYVAKVLGVVNIGKINFANSFVNYFLLIAGLGISTYATREGARLRNNKKDIELFISQMFTISFISTSLAYILLIVITFALPSLQSYKILIFIQSLNIIGNTIGVNWIFSIYEDYLYITIRTIIFQIISIILMFTFVKNSNDYLVYTWLLIISNSGANIFNLFYSKKYVKVKYTINLEIKKHIKPIMVIFTSAIATTIYVNSDSTMLGIIWGDYSVGLYSTAVKIYTIFKTLIASIIIVAMPRLSNYLANDKEDEFKKMITNIFNILLWILVPVVIGIFMCAKEIILIVADVTYLEATLSLRILSVSLMFATLGIYYTNAILLPKKNEKIIMKATIISAIINIILNLFFIRIWKQNGAAFTTAISELLVFTIQYIAVNKIIKIKIEKNEILTFITGGVSIFIICMLLDKMKINFYYILIYKVIISAISYAIISIMFKTSIICDFFNNIKLKNNKI